MTNIANGFALALRGGAGRLRRALAARRDVRAADLTMREVRASRLWHDFPLNIEAPNTRAR
jgi:hypothetical protein